MKPEIPIEANNLWRFVPAALVLLHLSRTLAPRLLAATGIATDLIGWLARHWVPRTLGTALPRALRHYRSQLFNSGLCT